MRVLENLLKRIQALEKTIGGASMRKAFEKGQKIKFVGPVWNLVGHRRCWEHSPQPGVIDEVRFDRLYVTAFDGEAIMIHPRQVTHRIIKKRKPREWWLYRRADGDFPEMGVSGETLEPGDRVRVREVL